MRVKENIGYQNFFTNKKKKAIQQFNNKTSRQEVFFGQGLILLINVFQNSNILDVCKDKIASKSAKHNQSKI